MLSEPIKNIETLIILKYKLTKPIEVIGVIDNEVEFRSRFMWCEEFNTIFHAIRVRISLSTLGICDHCKRSKDCDVKEYNPNGCWKFEF